MLSIKSLTFNNIATFIEEQKIDFTKFEKLVQVNGHNMDTGGGSGAAKSSIFHAQDYLFGINDIPASSLQSRLTKEPLYVEGHYKSNGVDLVIKRHKKNGLSIKYGDETVSGNVKLAEERLWEIIGVPKKLFKKMIHKKQKEGGFFLNLTAKESYEFLMTSLGLEDTIKKSYKIDSDIKKLKGTIDELTQAIELKEKSLEDVKQLKSFEKEPQALDVEDTEGLEDEFEKLKSVLQDKILQRDGEIGGLLKEKPVKPEPITNEENLNTISKYESEILSLKNSIGDLAKDQSEKKKKLDTMRDGLTKKINDIPHKENKVKEIVENIKNLIGQKEHLENNTCPTCSQKWSDEGAIAKIQELTSKIEDLKKEILSLKPDIEEKQTLENNLTTIENSYELIDRQKDIDDINKKINSINQKIVEIKASEGSENAKIEAEYLSKLNEYKDKKSLIEKKYQSEIDNLNQLISEKNSLINEIKLKISNYTNLVKSYKERVDNFENKIKEISNELDVDRTKLEGSKYNLLVSEEAKRALKSYTLQVFQDTLDYIGSYATEILSDIPNMSNTTIYFEGCKENKSGTIKDEVNAIVNVCGYDKVNIKTLSGGERTAIDLAVDLAVIDMIESKAGKGADFFILDEPFNGLEDINIAQCLEVLKQIDTNKKIIIVDHNPIAKEMITDGINVVKENGKSVVL